MAPSKTLVTAVCVILAAPFSYAAYQQWSLGVAAAVLVGIGIVLPRLYAFIAVPHSSDDA